MTKKRKPSFLEGARPLVLPVNVHEGEDLTPFKRQNGNREPSGDEELDALMADIFEADDDAEYPRITDAAMAVDFSVSPWTVRWLIGRRDGRLVVRGLRIEPDVAHTPGNGITADMLRELSPSAALAVAAQGAEHPTITKMIESTERIVKMLGPKSMDYLFDDEEAGARGRPRVSEQELAEVAVLYLEELKHGAGVTERLAASLDMPVGTVRDRIRMCRDPDRGLLSPTTQGRKGGEPGPRLVQLLQQIASERDDEEGQ